MNRNLLAVTAFLAVLCAGPPSPAQTYSPEELSQRNIERRAVEAVIWGMPIVSFDAMRQAFFGIGAT
jgi:hypothetical protein